MFSTRNKRRLAAVAAAVLAAPLLWLATSGTSQAAQAAVPAKDWLHVQGNQIVDEAGDPVWLTGTNWFGFNAGERVFHGLWSANLTEVTKSMADRGINLVRVPISTQLLLEWKAGQATVPSGVNTYANPELVGKTSLEVFDTFLALCERYGMKVLLDVHSAEADNSGHVYPVWYKGTVTPELFYQAWEWVATRYKTNDTLVAMDVKNEPHGKQSESPRAKWDSSTDVDNFKNTCQVAGRRILAINPNVLILCEGIEIYPKDGVTWSSTDEKAYDNVWWGGNLRGVRDHPVDLGANQDQLVYSPHDYGPLVYEQPWFQKPFDKATLTADVWTPNWLYVHDSGTAPLLVGEWGGRLGQDARQDRWMTALRDLIVEKHLHQTFWVLNPNSGDTGGLLLDDWKTWDEQKYALLKPALWQYAGKFVSLDHQVPLGGAGSTTGISLAARYGGGADPSTPPVSTPPTSTPPATGACSATYTQTGTWNGGFQGEVTIKNTGTTAGRTWTVTWTYPSGTSVSSLWNGVLSTSGSAVTVRNAAHNGSLPAGATATFGFVGSGPASTPTITCSST
ncbi:cellulase family glycosylhydrolase [Actinoplanes friuliensis]|uniref:Endoglucanase n=1 Tax=Actinoplanes friuliensis DSM 7358 TaxID=1246995 RepID=U5W260_9ACTN|nr:cellulase family glycosylhydrolase [Actinoplanes friuliensis]AGZ43214.1 putative glycosyl hydrolase [Actinoplanes friuliensis DSM 7358]